MSGVLATSLAGEVAQQLIAKDKRIVLAESCTGGMTAATFTAVPGISRCFCGSAVTYRDDTKSQWLDVSRLVIAEQTAVCEEVAKQMALGALAKTPEADFAASSTGHLGPDAPPELDGRVFFGLASRERQTQVVECRLAGPDRSARQAEAVIAMIRNLQAFIA